MTKLHATPFAARLATFDHRPRTRIVFGIDSLSRAGTLAQEYGASKALIVTDPGIVRAGHADRLRSALEAAGLTVRLFSDVIPNPTSDCVEASTAVAREFMPGLIIGLGGGSAMDTAKGCNFVLTNGGKIDQYWGWAKALKPMLPLMAIPTTAGTGSECQSYALISEPKSHRKMACGDPKAAAGIAILDPNLTLSQPFEVAAETGIDAIAHAVESAVTKTRNPLSLMYSHEAFKLAVTSLPRIFATPDDVEARARMLLSASFAGIAIENSMLGAAHSAANPLTAHYNIPHGRAVGLMLPHVIRFNAHDHETRQAYAELASAPELACMTDGLDEAVEALLAHVEHLLDAAQIARSLHAYAVDPAMIPQMAAEAVEQWTARHNPRPVSAADFAALYHAAFAG